MIILVIDEKIYHMQHLSMEPENLIFRLIIKDRHIVTQKK